MNALLYCVWRFRFFFVLVLVSFRRWSRWRCDGVRLMMMMMIVCPTGRTALLVQHTYIHAYVCTFSGSSASCCLVMMCCEKDIALLG